MCFISKGFKVVRTKVVIIPFNESDLCYILTVVKRKKTLQLRWICNPAVLISLKIVYYLTNLHAAGFQILRSRHEVNPAEPI